MSAMTTFAPASASAAAMPRPMPEAAPVPMAVLPCPFARVLFVDAILQGNQQNAASRRVRTVESSQFRDRMLLAERRIFQKLEVRKAWKAGHLKIFKTTSYSRQGGGVS